MLSSADPAIDVCGVPVHSWPHDAVLEDMRVNIAGPRTPSVITITNTESMYYALRDASHGDVIRTARFSLCDGIGVVLAARILGRKVQRFNGPVLMLKACDFGQAHGWRHYFYGGKPGVPELLTERLRQTYPALRVAGTYSPPFRPLQPDEEQAVVDDINGTSADIVWVGLGLLKQEQWVRRFVTRVRAPWLIGVGAAFDFHAGTARWAPAPFRALGLEWLYRLAYEPRMWVRNGRSALFLIDAVKYAIRKPHLHPRGSAD